MMNDTWQKPLSQRIIKPVTNFLNLSRDASKVDRHRELLMALQNPTLVHGYDSTFGIFTAHIKWKPKKWISCVWLYEESSLLSIIV